MTDVSQQTMAASGPVNVRSYRSPKRTAKALATQKRVIDAALALMAEGHFRSPSGEITGRAGVHRGTINHYWGHETLFYRDLARRHWEEVAQLLPFSLGICDFGGQYAQAAVWAVLVGEPRDLS